MRIGISLQTAHAPGDVRQPVRDLIERTRVANQAGLTSLFLGDHHVTTAPYYQNVPLLGRLLAEWGPRPAGALFLLPLWHPVLLAEQVATLAAIAEGPFIIQAGLGRGAREFGAMGVNIRHRPSLFEDSLAIIRRLLAGETVTAEGRFSLRDAAISPLPSSPVEVWVGGAVEPAVDRAARFGDAWLGGPELTFEQVAHWADFYRERCRTLGRPIGAVTLRRDIFVAANRAEAEDVASPILARGYRGFDPDALIWGDPADVARQLQRYADIGVAEVLVRHITGDQRHVLASIERLGRLRETL